MYKFGPVQKKIMITLLGGVALGMSSNPRQYFKTLRKVRKDWNNVDQYSFKRSVLRLSKEKLIEEKILPDGSFKLVLTKKGGEQAKKLNLLGNSIKLKLPKKWDGRWRIVIFDIPEKIGYFEIFCVDICISSNLLNCKIASLFHRILLKISFWN